MKPKIKKAAAALALCIISLLFGLSLSASLPYLK